MLVSGEGCAAYECELEAGGVEGVDVEVRMSEDVLGLEKILKLGKPSWNKKKLNNLNSTY